jgi:membrane protease YdiL (CAAX protease family)
LFVLSGWLLVHLSHPASGELAGHQKLILYCGAGIYEELVFRGFLLGLLVLGFTHVSGWKRTPAIISAAIVASLLFSLFHYIGPASDPFTFRSFVQRVLGGLYFSALFLTRGFGVTAASHALYDILVGIRILW